MARSRFQSNSLGEYLLYGPLFASKQDIIFTYVAWRKFSSPPPPLPYYPVSGQQLHVRLELAGHDLYLLDTL